ncbi:MAG TPA: hypothetical protein PLT82_05390 [Candidatus Hydrogenedens sp.]|nr:hypothetical protein [Candidatus Hydrogenedens sp.]HOL20711.1 hypothetical protein [Candidatus Hydrogenedens sp.]HPP58547.1 hypothetical protein [Candidatus Hydrogenedens sp.]
MTEKRTNNPILLENVLVANCVNKITIRILSEKRCPYSEASGLYTSWFINQLKQQL